MHKCGVRDYNLGMPASLQHVPTFGGLALKQLRFLLLPILLLGDALSGRACDLCGCYTPQIEAMSDMESANSRFYVAIGGQFTHFGTLQVEGHEIDNPTGQYLNSSITQLVVGYNINSRFALQLNMPLIYREFERPEGFEIDRGTESGLGDVSLLLKTVLFHYTAGGGRNFEVEGKNPVAIDREPEFTASAVLLTGIKFPTGDTSRIAEEFNEVEIPGAPESGIHGHDLTLGTGSYDGIFGVLSSLRYKNLFFEANVQFTLRGDGAYGYNFANDLTWNAGPGYYFVRRHDMIVGLQFAISGEHKDVDRFRGAQAEDTGITSVFVGPRLVVSRGRFSAEIGTEIPVSIENTALQVVPDYRLRGAISFHF
jgi:hypothetical protein